MNNIYWIDEYAKGRKEELQGHATCVIDGLAYRVDATGMTYYAGPVDKLKRLVDTPPDALLTTSAIENNEVSTPSNGNPPNRLL